MVNAADILSARILVVDDNAVNINLIERALRGAGYSSIESTTDPNAVCELYRRNRYGLILLDLQMPVLDGFAVMELLSEVAGESYLPVVVTTAEPGHKLRALKCGAKDFVTKPFDLVELRARVRNILEISLLRTELEKYGKLLEETIQELEGYRERFQIATAS
jgi:adenylate cyclase